MATAKRLPKVEPVILYGAAALLVYAWWKSRASLAGQALTAVGTGADTFTASTANAQQQTINQLVAADTSIVGAAVQASPIGWMQSSFQWGEQEGQKLYNWLFK